MLRPLDRRLRAALMVTLVVALLHVVAIFLPRELPEVDLSLAPLITHAESRSDHLRPLLDNPQSTPAHLHEAAGLVLPADPKLARQFLAEAERRGGAEAERRLLEARICHAEGNATCRAEALAHVRALLPDDPRPELVEADLAERDGDTERTLSALGRAHHKAPEELEIALRYTRALGTSGQLDRALAVLSGVEARMEPFAALRERGLLRLGGGDAAGAVADFEAATAARPSSGEAWYHLGVARFQLGDWGKAEVALREAARLEGNDWRPLALLCALQREQRRWEEAAISRSMLDARFRPRRAEYQRACPP